MSFMVQLLEDEPIIVVTLREPLAMHNPFELTREILRQTQNIIGTIYRITDLRHVQLNPTLVEKKILPDISFTSWRVRGVVVGEGAAIDELVDYTNHHFHMQYPLIACPTVEEALAFVRWEIKSL